jgi:hypothetical protein
MSITKHIGFTNTSKRETTQYDNNFTINYIPYIVMSAVPFIKTTDHGHFSAPPYS